MGWTDISMSVVGPVVDSLQSHFVERWNYIWKRKYEAKDGSKYSPLTYTPTQHHPGGIFGGIGEHHMGDMFRHRPHDQGQEQPGSSIVADWGARWNRHVGRLFDRDGDGDDAQQHHGGQHHGGQHDASATIQITRRYALYFESLREGKLANPPKLLGLVDGP